MTQVTPPNFLQHDSWIEPMWMSINFLVYYNRKIFHRSIDAITKYYIISYINSLIDNVAQKINVEYRVRLVLNKDANFKKIEEL